MKNQTVARCTLTPLLLSLHQVCQPLSKSATLEKSRAAALHAATDCQEFRSHCAPDGGATASPHKMSVAQLKVGLLGLGLPLAGTKAVLAARLEEALAAQKLAVKTEDEQQARMAAHAFEYSQISFTAGRAENLLVMPPPAPFNYLACMYGARLR